jgi:hypothetical protein
MHLWLIFSLPPTVAGLLSVVKLRSPSARPCPLFICSAFSPPFASPTLERLSCASAVLLLFSLSTRKDVSDDEIDW